MKSEQSFDYNRLRTVRRCDLIGEMANTFQEI